MSATDASARDVAFNLRKNNFHPTVIYPAGVVVDQKKGPENGKRPIGMAWGAKQIDPQQISRRFDDYPDAGVGICLGPGKAPDGRWLSDNEIDGPEGEESLAILFGGAPSDSMGWSSARGPHRLSIIGQEARLLTILPALYSVASGEDQDKGAVLKGDKLGLPGLELRIGGKNRPGAEYPFKQVHSACPPTAASNGGRRAWNGTWTLAEWPESAYEYLEARAAEIAEKAKASRNDKQAGASRGKSRTTARDPNAGRDGVAAYLEKAIRDAAEKVANAAPQASHDTLREESWTLARLRGCSDFDWSAAKDALRSAAKGRRIPDDETEDLLAGADGRTDFQIPDALAKAIDEREERRRQAKAGAGQSGDGGPSQAFPDGDEKETQAQALLRLAEVARLSHTPDGRCFATVPVDSHEENYPIRSTPMKRWLVRAYFEEREGPPSSEAMQAAIGVLEAQAQFDGPTEEIHTRVAGVANSTDPDNPVYYLDLCDDPWNAVQVSRDGWKVVAAPPVKFRRAKGMKPLPRPERGGKIDDLRKFVNVATDDDWRLLVAWWTAALRPTGPYPVLAMNGEQGSAKSTTSRVCRRAIDPHVTLLRCEPKEPRDLMIGATNSWVQAYDNLSGLPTWLSDALCRLSTGGGFATRTLYENDEETFFDAMRPVILNGIEDIASRGDLLDRCIALSLPSIPEEKRQEEGPFWRKFEAAHPKILAALLDAVAGGLKQLPATKLDQLPRMADFARWGEAVGRGLGWKKGAFLAAYLMNRANATDVAMESSQVAIAVRELMDREESWEGTAADLLAKLGELVGEKIAKAKGWPTTPRGLSGAVRRVVPALQVAGHPRRTRQTRPRRESARGKSRSPWTPPRRGGEPSQPSQPSRDDSGPDATSCHGEDLQQEGGRDGRRDGRRIPGRSTVPRMRAAGRSTVPRQGNRPGDRPGMAIDATRLMSSMLRKRSRGRGTVGTIGTVLSPYSPPRPGLMTRR